MNSARVTRPVRLFLFGSTVFVIGCLGAASIGVTQSGADYGLSGTVTENATTPPEAHYRSGGSLSAALAMPYFSFAQGLRPRSSS